jgi:hypothetical protein
MGPAESGKLRYVAFLGIPKQVCLMKAQLNS